MGNPLKKTSCLPYGRKTVWNCIHRGRVEDGSEEVGQTNWPKFAEKYEDVEVETTVVITQLTHTCLKQVILNRRSFEPFLYIDKREETPMKSAWFRGIETEVNCPLEALFQKRSLQNLIFIRFYSNWRAWKEEEMVWEVEFRQERSKICYTGISMWKESIKMKKFFVTLGQPFWYWLVVRNPKQRNYNR